MPYAQFWLPFLETPIFFNPLSFKKLFDGNTYVTDEGKAIGSVYKFISF